MAQISKIYVSQIQKVIQFADLQVSICTYLKLLMKCHSAEVGDVS